MSDAAAHVLPAGRVLKAREASLWITELDDLHAARARTERRRVAAGRAARIWREAARREGLKEARTRGEAEARETLGRLLARAEADRAEMRRVVPELVATLVRQVVGRCDVDAVLADAVDTALAEITDETAADGTIAVLRVPDAQADAVRPLLERAGRSLAVEADDRLDAAQALLVMGGVIVDVGLGSRLDAVLDAFDAEWSNETERTEGAA